MASTPSLSQTEVGTETEIKAKLSTYLDAKYKKGKLREIYEYAAGISEQSTKPRLKAKKLIQEISELCGGLTKLGIFAVFPIY